MKFGNLSRKGMDTTMFLAKWRDDEFDAGNSIKALRIQIIIDRRKLRHGGHIAYRI